MFQTDQPTAVSSLPAPAAPGTQGFFTGGNPASGQPATIVDPDWLNMIQMELINVVEAAGETPSKTAYNQVLSAIRRIGQNTLVLADTGAANAYTAVNPTPLVAGTWSDGVIQAVKIAHTNTGASTYSPDGLAAIPIYGLGLQPLQGSELLLNGTAILMHETIPGVNGGNPICVLMECAGGTQQVAAATQSQHAVQFGQVPAIVKQGGFQFSQTSLYGSGSITLAASQAGSFIDLGSPFSGTVTLPPLSSVPDGAAFYIWSGTSGTATVQRVGSDIINVSGTTVTSLALNNGDTLVIGKSGPANAWVAMWGSAQFPYSATGASLAPKPTSSAGVGQFQTITGTLNNALVLPTGGTWAYSIQPFNSSGQLSTSSPAAAASVAAGGSTVGAATSGWFWQGFAWRIQ